MKKYLTENRIIAFGVFLISLVVYLMTFQRTVPYWDCGEFIASGATMGVPHPPGAPFFTLLGRIFIMLVPIGDNPAIRMNFISVLASAFTVLFLYLILVQAITLFKKGLNSTSDKIITYGSAVIGSLAYSFSDSFWFSAVEAEVYALSLSFFSCTIWLSMRWYVKPDKAGNDKYLLLIGYLMGLSIGVHQLSLLAFFFAAWLVYFKMTEKINIKNLIVFIISAPILFFIIYPGIVEWLPSMLDGTIGNSEKSELISILPFIIILAIIYGIYATHKKHMKYFNMGLITMLLIILGYSTYIIIGVRAHDNPPLNMGDPSTTQRFVDFMERKQYGDPPPLTKRRASQDPDKVANYKNYTSDWDFFWRYQLTHMYFRYFGWNFIGRAGDIQDAPVYTGIPGREYIIREKDLKKIPSVQDGKPSWSIQKGWPQKYYAIPLIIGLLGLIYHFKKDWKVSIGMLSVFIVTGLGLIIFFNVPEPQPRERDYFVVGSFFVFAFWIGIGVTAIADFVKNSLKKEVFTGAVVGLFVLIIPGNMLLQNYHSHDRSLNKSAWDSGYNILQSCKKDAILFTAGDNDTYPLWYLQNAEGVRTDIRIINLSLVNVGWYAMQAKNDTPFGAKKVPMSLSDEELTVLGERFIAERPPQPSKMPAVPKEKWDEYGINDSSQISDLSFTIPAYTKYQGQDVIRMQDLIIYDIIMNSKWERPVYFALTSGQKDQIGLSQYLDCQGMALEVTPVKRNANRLRLNLSDFEKQLLTENVVPSKDFQRGFMFQNLNNPKLNIEEQAQEIVNTYRALYLMAARDVASTDKEKAKKYLEIMEKRMPNSVIKMRQDLLLDIWDLSIFLNDEAKAKYYVDIATDEATKNLAVNPNSLDDIQILASIYERGKQYDKAIEYYLKLQKLYPNDQRLKQQIIYLQTLSKNDTIKK